MNSTKKLTVIVRSTKKRQRKTVTSIIYMRFVDKAVRYIDNFRIVHIWFQLNKASSCQE